MREARERSHATQALYARLEGEVASSIGGGSGGGVVTGGKRARDEAPAMAPSDLSAWRDGGAQEISGVTMSYPGGLSADGTEASAAAAAAPAPAAAVEEELPAGWTSGVDPRYNVTYYVHAASGRSQWERPSE